jgi:hypothetical protein
MIARWLPRVRKGGWSMSDGDGPDIFDGWCVTLSWGPFVLELSGGRRG